MSEMLLDQAPLQMPALALAHTVSVPLLALDSLIKNSHGQKKSLHSFCPSVNQTFPVFLSF